MTLIVSALNEISQNYDALFVDLWGCVHNGVKAFPEAVDTLRDYRANGGKVILVTNAPRPRESVARQIDKLGVPEEAWDSIATSGDSARAAMFRGVVGSKVYFIGEDRDQSFFKTLNIIDDPIALTQVAVQEAEGIVCCGPFDPLADPDALRPELLLAKKMGLKLLCANPDIIVDRGETREWCAGAIAQLYSDMGGESLYFGKPHPPIYDLARRRLASLGQDIPDERILAIGDGIMTDVAGAIGESIDCLFISGGLAAKETKTDEHPDAQALSDYLNVHKMSPTYTIGFLR